MFNFFGQSNDAPTNAPAPTGQAQTPAQAPAGQEPTGQAAQQQGAASNEGQSTTPNPLDIYGKMFENIPDADKNSAPPSLNLDSSVLDKVTKDLDFTKGIDQASLDALQSGDLSSLPSILNLVAKQAYSTAMQHNSALVDKFVAQRSEYDAQRIAPTVRGALTETHLSNDVSGLEFPGMKQQLSETASRLAKHYPDQSPEWIATQAKSYVKDMAMQALGIKPDQLQTLQSNQQRQQAAESVDWSTYFDKG